MKVGFLFYAHPADRSWSVTRIMGEVARHLAGWGHEVSIYYPIRPSAQPGPSSWEGTRVLPVECRSLGGSPRMITWEMPRRVGKLIEPPLEVIVNGSSDAGGGALVHAAHHRGLKAVLQFQGLMSQFLSHRKAKGTRDRLGFWVDRMMLPRLEGRQARIADLLICSSKRTRQEVIDAHGVDPSRVRAIFNGYSPWPPRTAEERATALRDLQLDPKGFYASFVGSDQERKGIATARAAVKAARKQGVPARLLNVGRDVLQTPEEIGYGYLTDVPKRRVLAASDLFVYPTQYESSPMPVREAAALGLPVLTTPESCIEEGTPGSDYLLAPPGDVDGFRNALVRLYREPAWAAELGRRGQAQLGAWTFEAQARAWEGALKELIEGRPTATGTAASTSAPAGAPT